MKLSTIAILFVILGVAIYIQAMPTHDAPDTIPQTKPVEAQHQFPNLEVMGERKKRCNWNSDPTTTAGYSDPDFGHPPKAWDPVEPFAKNNKYFGTTRSPIRRRRSMDGMKFNYTILK
ncbi:uncharacterized protein LOC113560144 [Rhopalosiphum maidis]|uniref:uncharacterized protein LOC113560144 n=1 Tax=Rhopalosiphum maidis TaxID=43146 RepID=UPI000EFF1A06|nr:uncharacterized protein LOC113560144 [Rhopalosiphum maidis]